MTITQLQYILAIEKHLSFVDAANSCNISQPAISMQVKKLEDMLGVELFDRSSSPLKVTSIGKAIINQAKFIFKEYNQVFEIISEYKDEIIGTISDPYGEREYDLKAPADGFLIAINNKPVVNEGDALIHVGIEK